VNYFVSEKFPVPTFGNISDGFMVTIYGNVTENSENVTDDKIEIIIKYLKANSNLSATDLSILLGVKKRTVLRYLEKMKAENKIVRIGGAKGGHWQLLLP